MVGLIEGVIGFWRL